jgi:hypothetical protein
MLYLYKMVNTKIINSTINFTGFNYLKSGREVPEEIKHDKILNCILLIVLILGVYWHI